MKLSARMRSRMPAKPPDRPERPIGSEGEAAQPAPSRGPKRWPVLLALLATILVPALFWRQVWWGAQLSDAVLRERLSGHQHARQVQHALEQLSRRIAADPTGAQPFYPEVMALTEHAEPTVRSAAAWLMGEDNRYGPFRAHLQRLIADAEPVVRYNAAAALTRFADASGRPVLREMLRPHVVKAAWDGDADEGTVADTLRKDDPVSPGTQLALVGLPNSEQRAILAPLGGRLARVDIRRDAPIRRGDDVAAITPNADQVWAALRALALVGRADDLEDIERYAEPPAHFPARIAQQAGVTAAAIRRREGSS